jgi:hypothetical protein
LIERHGLRFPKDTDDSVIELAAFSASPFGEKRFEHFRRASELWENRYRPQTLMWNDYTERMHRAFCSSREVPVSGSAASWKTSSAAFYALKVWQSAPAHTKVLMSATTLDALKAKLWKETVSYYRICTNFGNLVQSRICIQWEKGSDDAGIYGVALDSGGDIEKVVNKIKGRHAPIVLVVVDELPTVNEAIVEACVNLETGCEWFQFIGLGNPDSELDPHGRMSEPKAGWDSVSVDTETWETKRGGLAVHLDGLRSPNLYKDIYPGMIRQRDIDRTIELYGEDSPQFWRERRGFWAPQGVTKTVLNPATINKFHARDKPIWVGGYTMGAALDPAFEGGDRCILRIGKCGAVEDEKSTENIFKEKGTRQTVGLSELITIKTQVTSDEPIHYQIVRRVKDLCSERGISPSMFALDATGEGGGLASIFHREWSTEILSVEFGGRPSNRPVSSTNSKPSDQEYVNKVTELWFGFRNFVTSNQIRGLDDETAGEFCRRWWEMRGNLIMVETKAKMKERTRRSPDLADATAVLIELFRQRIPDLRTTPEPYERSNRWREFQKKRSLTPEYV